MHRLALLTTLALVAAACGGTPPTLLPIGDREVAVGETLTFDVKATDPDTASLTFTADRLPTGATFQQYSDTAAEFRWSPTAADLGDTQVDFKVSDGRGEDTERVVLTVTAGSSAGPEFVGPSTWTLEAGQKSLEKIVEVQDDAARTIQWTPSGLPDGASFTPLVKRAVFFWEPTAAQRQQAQYSFSVKATNPDSGLEATKVFTILVQEGGGGGECTGAKPTVASTTPEAFEGANDFGVTATASDADSKVIGVTLSWAAGADPAADAFRAVEMTPAGGTWSAPVHLDADLAAGEFVTVTYEICARDDDDPNGDTCDQEACTGKQTFTARLAGGKGLCEPCAADADCGGPNDACIVYAADESFCGLDCAGGGTCPTGYECLALDGGAEQCQLPLDVPSCVASSSPAARAGDLVINEILADPAAGADANGDGIASTTGDEFVELVSTASGPVDIGGVTLSDAKQVRFTFPVGTVLGAGEAVVVFGGGNVANFGELGGALVFATSPNGDAGTLGLNNAGDELQLRDKDFGVIAVASYGAEGGQDQSLTLQPQVTGVTWVQHASAPGAAGAPFSPGVQSCGKQLPIATYGSCGGAACTSPNEDVEPNDTRADASCLSLPADVFGHLEYRAATSGPDAWDVFVFSARAGQKLSALTDTVASGGIDDTQLKLLDATGAVLAENDDAVDAQGNLTSLFAELVDVPIPADGTYYLQVGTYPSRQTDHVGGYELLVDVQ